MLEETFFQKDWETSLPYVASFIIFIWTVEIGTKELWGLYLPTPIN